MSGESSNPAEGASKKSAGEFVPPGIEDLDAVLDQYEFIGILGSGGMGAVYQGRQKSMNRLVAIKILPKVDDDDGLRFAERFQREARAMAQMSHPHIVTIYDFGQMSDGQLFFVMEYVDGTDLSHVIREGRLDQNQIFKWIEQICDALFYAHSMGVVHRDIKPANIMLTKAGVVKVADFGLAKLTGSGITDNLSRLTMTNVAMGTPDYVAPEALEVGAEVDHRADIYAMGVMLYEMLTGKIPRGVWKPPSELIEGVDKRFDEVVIRAMDADPSTRTQHANEFGTSVLAIRDQPMVRSAPAKARKVQLVTGPVKPPARDSAGSASPKRRMSPRKKVRTKESKAGIVLGSIAAIAAALAILGGVIFINLKRSRENEDQTTSTSSSASGSRTVEETNAGSPDAGKAAETSPSSAGKPPSSIQANEASLAAEIPAGLVRKFSGHEDVIQGVAILPDGTRGLSVSWDKTMKLWDLASGEVLRNYDSNASTMNSLRVSRNGQFALVGSNDSHAFLWKIESGAKVQEFLAPEFPTGGTAFSPNGLRLLIGGADGRFFLYDFYQPQEPMKSWQAHTGLARSASFLPDGRRFVTGGEGEKNSEVKLWHASAAEPEKVFGPHPNGVASLAVHSSGEFLLTGGGDGDGKLRLWNLKSGGAATRTLSGHPGALVLSVEFLPGSRFAVSSGTDRSIRMWDLIEGKKVEEIAADSHSTNFLGLSSDGRFALSGGGFEVNSGMEKDGDNDLRLWKMPETHGMDLKQDSPTDGPEWIDLLAPVDVAKDNRGGKWEKNEAGLFTDPDGVHEKLALPVRPKGNYDLNIRFQRISGDDATAIQLPVGDRFVNLVLNGWTRPGHPAKSALHPIDDIAGNQPANPTMTTVFQMESGRPYGVFVNVNQEASNARITVTVDDEGLIDWAGPLSDLVYDDPASPDGGRPWLSSAGTHVRFQKVQLRMNSGNAEFVREAP